MRDYQRSRVYKAEDSFSARSWVGDKSMGAVKEYVYQIYTDPWFRARWPHAVPPEQLVLHNGGGTRSAAAAWDYWLRLPRFARNQEFILHEITHLLLHRSKHHSAHGRLFCSTLLRLVQHYMGFDTFLALRQAMLERRVKFEL